MLSNSDLRLLRKQVAKDAAGKHRRVDLLAVGHQRVARQRVVMFPTRQLPDAAGCAVDGATPRAVALSPDHTLVIGRRDLSTSLNQPPVGVEEQLRVVERFAVAFVDADRHDYSSGPAGITNRVRGG